MCSGAQNSAARLGRTMDASSKLTATSTAATSGGRALLTGRRSCTMTVTFPGEEMQQQPAGAVGVE